MPALQSRGCRVTQGLSQGTCWTCVCGMRGTAVRHDWRDRQRPLQCALRDAVPGHGWDLGVMRQGCCRSAATHGVALVVRGPHLLAGVLLVGRSRAPAAGQWAHSPVLGVRDPPHANANANGRRSAATAYRQAGANTNTLCLLAHLMG